ncbi:translation elongation factor Ts [Mycoplasma phocoeninasale]|uniref:translation elongation factor Ts n=1 Tax=Mycoplasma phocoeninasale TaxID=2726117 RepID=UPI0019670A07|nr:translation elongation factor Ts [Mycoplasma phocoeninasale]MBN0970536.1 elongation factor Ts [Mycoplasma phocoeninasale]
MSVDLKKIKELRDRTNSGFLDCKNALEATNNDVEKAIDWLKEKGILKAAKKAGRIAADGIVKEFVKDNVAIMFELNCETDFVAKNEMFIELADKITNALLKEKFESAEDLKDLKIDGLTIEEHCNELTAKIGEKVAFRRATRFEAKDGEVVAGYTHANNKVASILIAKGSNQEALRQLAMHVAALNPAHIFESCLPKGELTMIHKKIDSDPKLLNKPEKIQNSMKAGMLRKEMVEKGVLVFQPFVMDESKTVAQFLEDSKLELIYSKRFEVGEGIEKNVVDFAAEVAEQMKQ